MEEELAKMVKSVVCERCPKCDGQGWLWRDELEQPNRGMFGGADDTKYSCDFCFPLAEAIVTGLRTAGYAKRSDTIEECAKVADAYAAEYLNLGDAECDASYESGKRIAFDIRNLKDKP